jgi:hypothetical protein
MRHFFEFFKSGDSFIGTWQLIFVMAGLVSAGDSVYVLYFPLKTQFAQTFDTLETATWVAVLVCVAYLVVVDFALMRFLPTTLAGLFSKKEVQQNVRSLYIGTLFFCIIQTVATIACTLTLRHSSAEIVTAKPVTTDIAALTANSNAAQATRIEAASADIQRIQKESAAAVNLAGSANRELARLAATGNGWASAQIREKERAAAAPYKKQLSDAQAQKSGAIGDPTLLAAIGAAAKLNDFAIGSFERRTKSFANFMMYLSIASTLIMWYAGGMKGFHDAAFGIGNLGQLVTTAIATTAEATSAPSQSVSTDNAPKAKKGKKKKKGKSVSTDTESVSTDVPKAAKTVSTDEKTVSTAKMTVVGGKDVKPVSTDTESVSTGEAVKDPNPTETVQIAMKEKIQDVNRECSNYERRDGKQNGDGDRIAQRLAEKMKEANSFINVNIEHSTPEIFELFNKAQERGKGTLGEHKEKKTKNPTLFDTAVGDKEVANG